MPKKAHKKIHGNKRGEPSSRHRKQANKAEEDKVSRFAIRSVIKEQGSINHENHHKNVMFHGSEADQKLLHLAIPYLRNVRVAPLTLILLDLRTDSFENSPGNDRLFGESNT